MILQYVLHGTLLHTSSNLILITFVFVLRLSLTVSLTMTAIVSSGLVSMISYLAPSAECRQGLQR